MLDLNFVRETVVVLYVGRVVVLHVDDFGAVTRIRTGRQVVVFFRKKDGRGPKEKVSGRSEG